MTPEKLEELAKAIHDLRLDSILTNGEFEDGRDERGAWVGCPLAEQSYLLAMAALEQAISHLKISELQQVRAYAGGV